MTYARLDFDRLRKIVRIDIHAITIYDHRFRKILIDDISFFIALGLVGCRIDHLLAFLLCNFSGHRDDQLRPRDQLLPAPFISNRPNDNRAEAFNTNRPNN
jgi:hypothetical protein